MSRMESSLPFPIALRERASTPSPCDLPGLDGHHLVGDGHRPHLQESEARPFAGTVGKRHGELDLHLLAERLLRDSQQFPDPPVERPLLQGEQRSEVETRGPRGPVPRTSRSDSAV